MRHRTVGDLRRTQGGVPLNAPSPSRDLTRFAWFSIGVALVTMAVKGSAWLLTGSVGLLSDALESLVNLAAGLLMLVALRVAALPPDENHQHGHEKAELFSAAAEGLMIAVAAAAIGWAAVDRLVDPQPVERIGVGVLVSVAAAALNSTAGVVLLRAARRHDSAALAADGRHLLVDVWTTAGVLGGLGVVAATGWTVLDPLLALAVGVNVVHTGVRVLWGSVRGLMDPTIPVSEQLAIEEVIGRWERQGIAFHALRTRASGPRRFMSIHVLVPGRWTVGAGHDVLERIEAEFRAAVPNLHILTHLEPVEDPSSYFDEGLERSDER